MNHQVAIAKLKTNVINSQDFMAIWNEFFDLTLLPQFMARSIPSRPENLEAMLYQICLAMAPWEIMMLEANKILQYKNSGLYHGAISSINKMGTFLYFKDLNTGMATLRDNTTGNIEFCRFTATIVSSPHCYTPPAADNGLYPIH